MPKAKKLYKIEVDLGNAGDLEDEARDSIASHDREFLDNVVTSTFAMDGEGGIAAYPGGYEDYARQSAAAKNMTWRF